MKKIRISASAILVILVLGCASTPQASLGSKSLSLKVGMSKPEVWAVFGEPQTTSMEQNRETWHYWQIRTTGGLFGSMLLLPSDPMFAPAHDRLSISFVDDKLESWGDQAGIMGAMKETLKNMPAIQIQQTVQQIPSPSDGQENPLR